MKKVICILLAVGLCAATVFAGNSDGGSSMENKGFIGKVIDGFAESTRIVNEINKENLATVKAESKANFQTATAPDPGMVELKQAKGFKNKVSVIFSNMKNSAQANSAKEQERREEIMSFDWYRTMLNGQNQSRQNILNY